MKKAGTKNAGKQEKTVKESKPKNGKKKAATPRELPSERLGVPPTTPDVDAKVKAAEAAHDAPTVAAKPTEATKDASAKTGRDTGERGATGGQPVAEGGKAMSLWKRGDMETRGQENSCQENSCQETRGQGNEGTGNEGTGK